MADFSPLLRRSSPLSEQRDANPQVRARRVQSKMLIGASHDPHEREADRIAAQVMRDTTPLDRRHEGDRGGSAPQSGESVASPTFTHDALRLLHHGGRPLEDDARRALGSHFTASLSHVRVHDDLESASLAREIHARAFTLDHHIFFDHGELAPHTRSGRRLLAHELAHVAQQAASPGAPGVVRREIKFHDGVAAAKTKYMDREGRIGESGELGTQFRIGLSKVFGIEVVRVDQGNGVVGLEFVSAVPIEALKKQFEGSPFGSWLGAEGRKVLVPSPILSDDDASMNRFDKEDDYEAVGADEVWARYVFVRKALIKRLESGVLNIQESTSEQGKEEAISHSGAKLGHRIGLGEEERIEVTKEKYNDVLVTDRSGWDGFWILTHEILHSAGRGDDKKAGGIVTNPYGNTSKEINLRGPLPGAARIGQAGEEQPWTTVGEAEYDLNMVRLVVGEKPLRTGYADQLKTADVTKNNSDVFVRFSDASAPKDVGQGRGEPYSIKAQAQGEHVEYIGAYMKAGKDKLAQQTHDDEAPTVLEREGSKWAHILNQGHPGFFDGHLARFTYFGDGNGGKLAVERAGLSPKLFSCRLQIGIAARVAGEAKPRPENVALAERAGPGSITLGTSSAGGYERAMQELLSGERRMQGALGGKQVFMNLYAELPSFRPRKRK